TQTDLSELLHELNVYHAELEIQNEELRRSHRDHESLLSEYVGIYYDSAPCGYVTLSSQGLITRINLAGASLLKSPRLNLENRPLRNFISRPCHINYLMTLNDAARTGEIQSAELRLKTDDKWVLASVQPDMNESGELAQWRITLADMSVFKEKEIEFIEREERFRFLFENVPFACLFLNSDGDIIEVNQSWEKITGYNRTLVIKRDFVNFIHPEWRGSFKKSYSRLKSENRENIIEFQFAMSKTDGSYFHVNAQARSCLDRNGVFSHACFCFNPAANSGSEEQQKFSCPTAMHHALPEGAVTEDEKQFFAIMEELPGSLMQLDSTGRIVFANRACRNMFMLPQGTLVGRFCWDLASTPEKISYIRNWFNNNIEHLVLPEPFHAEFETQGARRFTLKIDWNYRYDHKGRVKGIILLLNMTDISTARQKEYNLEKSLECQNEKVISLEQEIDKLDSTIKILTQKLNDQKNETEQRVSESANTLILPYVEKLKNANPTTGQKKLLAILESNINEMVSPFAKKMKQMDFTLTPMEIQIAHLISQGNISKQIASILCISSRTVDFHRDNLRLKLGIKNKKTNLRSMLLAICQ
ncbi:MAG: PAS domain S-box protein, partial [Desulfamplus sp.]|nr:PAS domain S-box protein [Desulfamplus sp.]